MSEGVDGECRGLVFQFVVGKKFVGGLLDRLPALFPILFFQDLAIALLQPLPLDALLRDRQLLVGGAGRAAAPAPIQLELVMVERAVLENAHCVGLPLASQANRRCTPFLTSVGETVKSKTCAAGQPRAAVDYTVLRRHRRPVEIPEKR